MHCIYQFPTIIHRYVSKLLIIALKQLHFVTRNTLNYSATATWKTNTYIPLDAFCNSDGVDELVFRNRKPTCPCV